MFARCLEMSLFRSRACSAVVTPDRRTPSIKDRNSLRCGLPSRRPGTDLRTMLDYLGHRDPRIRLITPALPGAGLRDCASRACHQPPITARGRMPAHFHVAGAGLVGNGFEQTSLGR